MFVVISEPLLMTIGNTLTCFGSMYLSWYLMRWMIWPSEESYTAIPEWFRPTYVSRSFSHSKTSPDGLVSSPNQLFMPHIYVVDFVAWPAFRELAVQIPTMQERMEWLMDMTQSIHCDWSFTAEEALSKDEETGNVRLCPVAKVKTPPSIHIDEADTLQDTIWDLSNWSVAPSFRGYVSNADTYVRIRTEGL